MRTHVEHISGIQGMKNGYRIYIDRSLRKSEQEKEQQKKHNVLTVTVNREITSLWYIITSGFSVHLLLIHCIGTQSFIMICLSSCPCHRLFFSILALLYHFFLSSFNLILLFILYCTFQTLRTQYSILHKNLPTDSNTHKIQLEFIIRFLLCSFRVHVVHSRFFFVCVCLASAILCLDV